MRGREKKREEKEGLNERKIKRRTTPGKVKNEQKENTILFLFLPLSLSHLSHLSHSSYRMRMMFDSPDSSESGAIRGGTVMGVEGVRMTSALCIRLVVGYIF